MRWLEAYVRAIGGYVIRSSQSEDRYQHLTKDDERRHLSLDVRARLSNAWEVSVTAKNQPR